MRLIDADRLKVVLEKNFGHTGGAATMLQLIDIQPTIEPEPKKGEWLTDDDIETIRIHLNAFKETLCNQQRWKEAEEYQRIIDRFMSFASAQPEQKKEGVKSHITNADRIRSMTDEELAEWLENIDTAFEPETIVSQRGWLCWLKQVVKQ